MKYTFYNIGNIIKKERFIFLVMLLCVFVSAWTMTFSYGLYHHYSAMRIEEAEIGKEIRPEIAEGMTLTRGDIVNYFNEVSQKTLDAINIILAQCNISYTNETGNESGTVMMSRFIVRNGLILPSQYIVQHWNDNNMIDSGRYISDDEEVTGEKVALISDDYPVTLITNRGTIELDGDEYAVIGTHTSFGIIVPLLSFPENAEISNFVMVFEKSMTLNQYNEMKSVAEDVLPGMFVFPEPEFPDEESIYIYNNMMIVSVLIAALSIINFAFLYSFILGKRTRTLAIMRICGCTEGRAWGICLGECCLICIPTFIIGVLTYIPFMQGMLSKLFKFIEEAYSLPVYAILFAIYTVMLFVIMGVMLKKQTSRELVEGRKGGAI